MAAVGTRPAEVGSVALAEPDPAELNAVDSLAAVAVAHPAARAAQASRRVVVRLAEQHPVAAALGGIVLRQAVPAPLAVHPLSRPLHTTDT